MKHWPKDDKPCDYEKIINPLTKFGRQILADKDFKKTVKFTGYREGLLSRVTCLNGDYWSSPKNRKYELEDKGRDPLELLLGLVFRAGMEQGRRVTIDNG